MGRATAGQIRNEDQATEADHAAQDRAPAGELAPSQHRTSPVFLRVLRDDANRPEVVHTPGEALPDDVAQALDAGRGTAGTDGVTVVDLR